MNSWLSREKPSFVRAWFDSRLTFEALRLKAKVAGLDLIGGRLCWLLKRRLGAFAYQRGDQKIALYVMTAHDLTLPSSSFDPELGISMSSHEADGFRTMIWRADELNYTVVSDMPKQDMSIFLAALARSQMAVSNTLPPLLAHHGHVDEHDVAHNDPVVGDQA